VYEGDDLMAFSSEEEQLRKFRNDEIAQRYFEVLRTLISKKSIFAQNIGLYDVAAYLGEIFSGVGAEVTIDETHTAPFVLAKVKSPNPDAKTIIFYQHYDTVPADNDQPWTDEPFRLTVRKGYMYGRGVDDDNGLCLFLFPHSTLFDVGNRRVVPRFLGVEHLVLSVLGSGEIQIQLHSHSWISALLHSNASICAHKHRERGSKRQFKSTFLQHTKLWILAW